MSNKPGMTTPRRKIDGFYLHFAVDPQGNCLLDFELTDEMIADLIVGMFFGTTKENRTAIFGTLAAAARTGRAEVSPAAYQIAAGFGPEATHDIVEFADDGNIYEVGPLDAAPGKHQA